MTPPMKNSTNQAKPRAPPRRHQAPPLVVGLLTDISFTPCVPSKVVPSFLSGLEGSSESIQDWHRTHSVRLQIGPHRVLKFFLDICHQGYCYSLGRSAFESRSRICSQVAASISPRAYRWSRMSD